MNVVAEINALEALADLAAEKAAMIKAYCQQVKKKTGGVSTPTKSRKKGTLSNKQKADLLAKSRARRNII